MDSGRSLLRFRKYAITVILRSPRTEFWVLNHFGFQNLNSSAYFKKKDDEDDDGGGGDEEDDDDEDDDDGW